MRPDHSFVRSFVVVVLCVSGIINVTYWIVWGRERLADVMYEIYYLMIDRQNREKQWRAMHVIGLFVAETEVVCWRLCFRQFLKDFFFFAFSSDMEMNDQSYAWKWILIILGWMMFLKNCAFYLIPCFIYSILPNYIELMRSRESCLQH